MTQFSESNLFEYAEAAFHLIDSISAEELSDQSRTGLQAATHLLNYSVNAVKGFRKLEDPRKCVLKTLRESLEHEWGYCNASGSNGELVAIRIQKAINMIDGILGDE